MPHAKAPMGSDVPCYACPGRFSFSHEADSDRFVCRHTTPYCEAFDDIRTTIDALRHAERCDAAERRLGRQERPEQQEPETAPSEPKPQPSDPKPF